MDKDKTHRIAPAAAVKTETNGDGPGPGPHGPGDGAPVTPTTRLTPKKRRKVNHACVYCRRSHMTCDLARPCTRCIKRNIGHLCHDEPRDSESRKSKSVMGTSVADESEDFSNPRRSSIDQKSLQAMRPPSFDAGSSAAREATKSAFAAGMLAQGNPLQLVPPRAVSGMQPNVMGSDVSQFAGFSDAWLTAQNHFHDMHTDSNYMIVPEVSGELQFLNDFLQSSMVDDAAYVSDDQNNNNNSNSNSTNPANNPLLRGAAADVAARFLAEGAKNNGAGNALLTSVTDPSGSMLPPASVSLMDTAVTPTAAGTMPARTADKAREYYMQAADPSGNDTPEQRMSDTLKAKYDAGLLKPFNYISGYARLYAYLDSHKIATASKQKILRQLDRFRPKFREKMQALTDIELIYVEMWFEKTLMEYDRVFASMAVPACCWRRTGEIFRGNKEMAELIGVPVENLRDGKISLHEILTEESMVRYWEEFGTIAFDPQHDTLLTACSIRNPDDADGERIKCCFSLKIRRDDHKIPSLIVGNFLPHDPVTALH